MKKTVSVLLAGAVLAGALAGCGNNNGGNGTVISVDKARSIALAKVPGASANDIRIHLDRDDGRQIYEGEIYYNRMEYEFEIDASTGTIIEWSAEHWD